MATPSSSRRITGSQTSDSSADNSNSPMQSSEHAESENESEPNPTQLQLQLGNEGAVSEREWRYDPMVSRECLVRLIASCDLPITFGDSDSFESFIQSFCPMYKRFSYETTIGDVEVYYRKHLAALKSEISESDFCVALAYGTWSGEYWEKYVSVVAHYLDSSWTSHTKMIAFKPVEGDSEDFVSECVLSVTDDFNIRNRIISVTFDDPFANTKLIHELQQSVTAYNGGFLLNQRCACYIITRMVKSGMRLMEQYVGKVRSAVLWLISSDQRISKFKEFCTSYNMKPIRLDVDMPIRWDSTYFMLKRAVEYKSALELVHSYEMRSALDGDDWAVIDNFVKLLDVLHGATVSLSGGCYPTTPAFFKLIEIADSFRKHANDEFVKDVVAAMVEKYKKYWFEVPLLYCFGAILDPRLRYSRFCKGMNLIGKCLDLDYSCYCTHVRQQLSDVYQKYKMKFGNSRPKQVQEERRNRGDFGLLIDIGVFKCASTAATELETYLVDDFCIPDFKLDLDVLQWWQSHKGQFPVLSQLAHDILTVQVTINAAESAFSMSYKKLDDRRSGLSSDLVEMLACIRDWELGHKGMQRGMEDEDLDDDDDDDDEDATNDEHL